jgi:hypothetical protein
MRFYLTAFLFFQMTLSRLSSDHNAIATLEATKDEEAQQKDTISSVNQDVPHSTPKDASRITNTIETRQDASAETKSYMVYASDIHNEAEINETRTWLEGLTKDKSKMREETRFPWDTPEDIPEDELDKLYEEGRLHAEPDNYEVPYAWFNVMLDQSG